MLQRAARERWFEGRWPTNATASDIEAAQGIHGDLTMKEAAAKAVMDGLAASDPRIKMIAAKTVVAMEAQNQRDDHLPALSGPLQQTDRGQTLASELSAIIDRAALTPGFLASMRDATRNDGPATNGQSLPAPNGGGGLFRAIG